MNAVGIVILPEAFQFPLQVVCIPEDYLIQEFVPNGSNQPFDRGM